jgi:uncharacterized protein YbdZ (MbtH family)
MGSRRRTVNASIPITVLALATICWGGDQAEPAYERGVVTEISNAGRPMDHWFIIQTECCNYTVQNWRSFSGFTIGGSNDVSIRDDHAFIRVGKKVGKARILNARQREGFDPTLAVVADPQGEFYRTSDIASIPDGWEIVARDAKNKLTTLPKNSVLPEGWQLVHGIAGLALPPVLRGKP